MLLLLFDGLLLFRFAERQLFALLFQLPPRFTRFEPVCHHAFCATCAAHICPPRPTMTAGRGKRTLEPSFPPSTSFLKSAGLRPFRPDGLADFAKDASVGTKVHRTKGRQRTRKPMLLLLFDG